MSMSIGKRFLGAQALLLALLAACGEASSDAGNVNGRTGGADSLAVAAPAAARPSLNVVFAGTSLTAGLGLEPEHAYPSLVEAKIDSAGLPYTVINAGISGETSSGLLRRLDWLLQGEFDVLVLETGANDGLRGIPVEAARRNIDSALTLIRRAQPQAAIVLVQMEAPPNLGREYTEAFRRMYAELGRQHGATVMPFLLEGVAGDPAMNQADGIHPNETGAQRVAENVWRVLEPLLAARSTGAPGPPGVVDASVGSP